jgi:sialate O-acetylesterase
MHRWHWAILGLLLVAPAAWADVKPHALISDGMVLQRDSTVKIWGKADAGEKVTVSFRGATATQATPADGTWVIEIPSKEAGGPFTLDIAGNNKITLKDVYVGEVWVCSGQSNMQWSVNQSGEADRKLATESPANPQIRMFTVARGPSATPQFDVKGQWLEANPKNVGNFSAVGYFFGRDLQAKLNVPIGLISSNVGGTRAEAWTSPKVLAAHPMYKDEMAKFEAAWKQYQETLKGKPDKPPQSPMNQNSPGALYNAMIHPITNYKIKGAIWYQGESNAGKAAEYATLMPLMIENWRADFKCGEFPFYQVQLASFMAVEKEPAESNWAVVREAQWLTTRKLKNVGQAVITDYGHESDIHPTPKSPVGQRLALLARARTYGEKGLVCCGPEVRDFKFEGNKAIIQFEHVAGGLEAREWERTDIRKDKAGNERAAYRSKAGSPSTVLQGFAIAGEDGKFVNANAKIEGNTVVVFSEKVPKPTGVRYGWANYPLGNLFNKEGLPASPFRFGTQKVGATDK